MYEERPVSSEGLVLHQDFDEGPSECDLTSSNACLEDESGESNDGTPQNFDDNDFNTGSGWFNQTPLNRPSLEDSSENSNTARFYGGNDGALKNFNFSESGSRWTSGVEGDSALEFDGNDDYVDVRNSGSFFGNMNRFSVSFWARWDSLNSWSRIVDFGSSRGNNGAVLIANNNGRDDLTAEIRNSTGQSLGKCTASNNITVGDLDHWTITWANGSQRIYKNGELLKSCSYTGSWQDINEPNKYFGRSNWGSDGNFSGIIEHIRVYNKILTSSEINSLYQGESVTGGLVGRWNFEAGDRKTAYDTSSLDREGVLGTSGVGFDGEDDIVKVADDPSLDIGDGGWSVSSWVRLNQVNNSWMVIDKGTSENGTYYLYDAGGHGLTWTVKNGTNRFDAGINSKWYETVSRGRWAHLAGVYDEEHVKLYVNGRLYDKSEADDNAGSNNQPLWIGAYQGGSYRLNGSVDEVRVYNRSLSQKEVQRLVFQ